MRRKKTHKSIGTRSFSKNPADINPKENDPAIIPIIPSGKFLYLAKITTRVKKNPSQIQKYRNKEIQKY